jgi:hypothetical protein
LASRQSLDAERESHEAIDFQASLFGGLLRTLCLESVPLFFLALLLFLRTRPRLFFLFRQRPLLLGGKFRALRVPIVKALFHALYRVQISSRFVAPDLPHGVFFTRGLATARFLKKGNAFPPTGTFLGQAFRKPIVLKENPAPAADRSRSRKGTNYQPLASPHPSPGREPYSAQ